MTGFCAICGKAASVAVQKRRGLCTACAWRATRELERAGALSVRLQAGGWPQERELQLGDGAVLVRIADLVPGAEGSTP